MEKKKMKPEPLKEWGWAYLIVLIGELTLFLLVEYPLKVIVMTIISNIIVAISLFSLFGNAKEEKTSEKRKVGEVKCQ